MPGWPRVAAGAACVLVLAALTILLAHSGDEVTNVSLEMVEHMVQLLGVPTVNGTQATSSWSSSSTPSVSQQQQQQQQQHKHMRKEDMLKVGAFAVDAHRTLLRHTWPLRRLEALDSKLLCAKRFMVIDVPTAMWGNAIHDRATKALAALLSNRVLVINEHGRLNEMLAPNIATVPEVVALLSARKCHNTHKKDTSTIKTVHSANFTSPIKSLGAALADFQRKAGDDYFVALGETQHTWLMPPDALDVITKKTKDDPALLDLLTHPAFVGLVQLTVYRLGAPVLDLIERRMKAVPVSPAISMHVRHRQSDVEPALIGCVRAIEQEDEFISTASAALPSIYIATDRLDLTSSQLSANLKNPLTFLNFTDECVHDQLFCKKFHQISHETTWGTPGKDGWWGEDPSAAGLCDLFSLALVGSRRFIGTQLSTFSSAAISLWLAVTDHPPEDLIVYMTKPRSSTCSTMSLGEFWQFSVERH